MVVCSNRAPDDTFQAPTVDRIMPKKRAKKKTFSAVKAVKANARERVGQPKPERAIPPVSRELKRGQKHPKNLVRWIAEEN